MITDLLDRHGVPLTFVTVRTALIAASELTRLDQILSLLVSGGRLDGDQLDPVEALVGEGWSMPRSLIAIRQRQVDQARDQEDPAALARAVHNLGVGLARVGYEEALTAYLEAAGSPRLNRRRGAGRAAPASY